LTKDGKEYVSLDSLDIVVGLSQPQLFSGMDEAVSTMKVGEKATFHFHNEYGYGVAGHPPKVPPKSDLFFSVELLKIETTKLRNKDKHHVHPTERHDHVERLMVAGENLMKKDVPDLVGAIAIYQQAAQLSKPDDSENPCDLVGQDNALYAECMVTISYCHVKLGDWRKAVIASTMCIETNNEKATPKALYIRSHSYLKMGQLEASKKDATYAYSLNTGSKKIRDLIERIKAAMDTENNNE
jgi:tetratricopeptide (TPR) repeat protein